MDRLLDWLDNAATALGFWVIILSAVGFSLAPVWI